MSSVAGHAKRRNRRRRLTPNGMHLSEEKLDAEKLRKTKSESARSVSEKTVPGQTKRPRWRKRDESVPREKRQDAPPKKKTKRVFFLHETFPSRNLCHRRL
jgi:hypothetical protein